MKLPKIIAFHRKSIKENHVQKNRLWFWLVRLFFSFYRFMFKLTLIQFDSVSLFHQNRHRLCMTDLQLHLLISWPHESFVIVTDISYQRVTKTTFMFLTIPSAAFNIDKPYFCSSSLISFLYQKRNAATCLTQSSYIKEAIFL